jgi:hypothetical protein
VAVVQVAVAQGGEAEHAEVVRAGALSGGSRGAQRAVPAALSMAAANPRRPATAGASDPSVARWQPWSSVTRFAPARQ